ncbi:hypothetical protein QAD02_018384 [Eretmocerus hayati]|uniref:Uncharacterized protein n=1 Tax=Eretmocerus hayati TaxID=131215 RepID=A0ACC2PGJ3_9HYME|nr:hypothetical protein QAD02_018384 [Eretmocerus hayati]
MDVDARGVKRGQCIAEGCDCPQFERSENKSISTCYYCLCPPTKHRRIEHETDTSLGSLEGCSINDTAGNVKIVKKQDSLKFDEKKLMNCASQLSEDMFELALDSELDGSSILKEDAESFTIFVPPTPSYAKSNSGENICTEYNEIPTSSQNGVDDEPGDELSDEQSAEIPQTPKIKKPFERRIEKTLQEKKESSTRKEEAIRSVWPKGWPKNVREAQRGQKADSGTRNLILRTVKNRLVENNFEDLEDFDIAARCIVEEFPFFTSRINPDHKHVAALLRKSYSNSKSYYKTKSSKKTKNSSTSSDTAEKTGERNITVLMEQELAKKTPSITMLKKYLDECRTKRLEELKSSQLPAGMHLKRYPALKRSDMVTYEFEKLSKIPTIGLKANWISALSKIKVYFCIEDDIGNNDSLTIQALNCICQKLCKKKKNHPRCIMAIHDESTVLQDVQPRADDHPYLIGIGDVSKENSSFTFYVDNEPMFSGGAVDALISMYCCYWLFNLNYDNRYQLPFMFVETVLFKEKAVSNISKKTSIVTLLTDLEIL